MNKQTTTLQWEALVAQKTQEVFFVAVGAGKPQDAEFDSLSKEVNFLLDGKPCKLVGIPQEVCDKVAEGRAFLNIKDDSAMKILETPIKTRKA